MLTKSNMDKILEPAGKILSQPTCQVKVCSKCKTQKSDSDFHRLKTSLDGLQSWCKHCFNDRSKRSDYRAQQALYKKTPSRKDWAANYYARNRSRLLSYAKRYYNRKGVRELRRTARSLRRQRNPNSKISENLRSRLNAALKRCNKSSGMFDLIGCDIGFLRRWIEAKWKPGMSWDNYGRKGWHIDHIMPCASFDLSDPKQQRICFRWTNLQPLWALDNIKKSDKLFETPAEPLA